MMCSVLVFLGHDAAIQDHLELCFRDYIFYVMLVHVFLSEIF